MIEPVVNDVVSFFGMSAKLNFYILIPVLSAVGGLGVSYLKNYQWPAEIIRDRLTDVVARIRGLRNEPGLSLDELEDRLFAIFDQSPFAKLWAEYRHSLHVVQSREADGGESVKTVLATVPAEAYFSKETIVDLKINADFYRHLPGILTGIGIIGTFSGLVWGLHQFKPDPDQTMESLPLLLQEVTSAFVGSGLAILAAIFITYKEKSILTECYRLVDALTKEIDSLYTAGAGEAYLARLVMEAEGSNAAQQSLKTALVGDLARLMYSVSERQIAAQQVQMQAMTQHISDSIHTALAQPMAALSVAVQEVTRNQQDAVGGLIDNLQTGFMDRLGDAFGGQIQGINKSIQQSSETIGEVQAAVSRSINDIAGAGVSAADRVSGRLEDFILRMMTAQEQMTRQMGEQQQRFSTVMDATVQTAMERLNSAMGVMADDRARQIEQDRQRHENLLAGAQILYGDLSQNVARIVDDIRAVTGRAGEELAAMQHNAFAVMAAERNRIAAADEERQQNLLVSAEALYGGLTNSVNRLVDDIRAVSTATGRDLETIRNTAFTAADGIQQGALVMREAADRFTTAGASLSGVTGDMGEAARIMQSTTGLMRQAFGEYETMRTSVERQVLHLQDLVALAGAETGVSRKLVDDMDRIVASFSRAEQESRDYLFRINEVLKQAFQEFGVEMIGQVRTMSAETNRQLGTSLQALSGTVDSMVASVSKLRRAG